MGVRARFRRLGGQGLAGPNQHAGMQYQFNIFSQIVHVDLSSSVADALERAFQTADRPMGLLGRFAAGGSTYDFQ